MANDVNLSEILITPAAKMIRELSASVADAQRTLDAEAMATQAALATSNPELAAAGYQVTWYQIPEAEMELKVVVHFERQDAGSPLRAYLAPYNTKYRTSLAFTADGTSTVKFRIVPVPPVTEPPK